MNRSKNEAIIFQVFSFIAIPVLTILAVALLVCGIVTPIAGIVQMLASVFHWDIPFIEYIKARVGGTDFGAVASLIIFIIAGIVLFLIGVVCWKLLRYYLGKMKS